MDLFYRAVFVALGVALVATALLSRARVFQEWEAGRLARRVGLGIPGDLCALVHRRVASRLLGSSAGGVTGLLVGLLAYEALGRPTGIVALYLVLFLAVSGASLGTVGAALRGESRDGDRPRLARIEAVSVRDYLVRLVPLLAWVVVGLSAAILLLASVGGSAVRPIGLFLCGLGLAEMIVFEIVSRRIVARGRPATSTDEMVWNDALTSSALRDLVSAPLQVVTFGALYALLFATGLSSTFTAVGWILAALLFVVAIAYSAVFRSTPTWYLTQLWPGARRRTAEEESRRAAAVHVS